MRKLRLSSFQRSKAVVHLKNGLSISETSAKLQSKYHKDYTLEEVQASYFPKSGMFKIDQLEGRKDRIEFLRRIQTMNRATAKHKEKMKEIMADPARRAKQSEVMTNLTKRADFAAGAKLGREKGNSPKIIEKKRNKLKEAWQDPEYRFEMSQRARLAMQNPEVRAAFIRAGTLAMQKYFSDPSNHTKHSEMLKAFCADPEIRRLRSERMKALMQNPDFRLMSRLAIIAYRARPEVKAKYSALGKRPEQVEKLREINRLRSQKAAHEQAIAHQDSAVGLGFENDKLVPVVQGNFEEDLDSKRRSKAIAFSLSKLTPIQMGLVVKTFELDQEIDPDVEFEIADLPEEEKHMQLELALAQLSKSKHLRDFLS